MTRWDFLPEGAFCLRGVLAKGGFFQEGVLAGMGYWPEWSAATFHMSLLDRVVSQVSRLSGGSVTCDLWHRRKVASLSVFFKIDSLVDHPVSGLFPAQYVLRRPTRGALAAHSRSFEMLRSIELCSFRALLFCLVFICGMGCMSLSLLVKVSVLLKLQSIAFFYKVDCPLFLPFL